ncbi:MAG TPA: serine hydrolase [Acetobacteraceae bacterium]
MSDPAAALSRVFGPAPLSPDLFTPAFRAAAPPDQVALLVAGLIQAHGRFTGVTAGASVVIVHLANADVPADIALDAAGRIAGLRLRAAEPTGGTLQDYVHAVAALPGRTAVLVTTDGRRRGEHRADEPLAVGSAFKLAILRAVALAVDGGVLAWDQVVPLDPARRSLPSGILQDWPEDAPVTLATLANLMISVSDNTAADALIHVVGRNAVETVSPRNAPFPTTREAFIAKADPALRTEWQSASPAGRRTLLDRIAALPLPMSGLETVTAGVEWYATAAELCVLLDATCHLPPFRISPGPVRPEPWSLVAYKGGAEPGVLNLSALMVSPAGIKHCVVATWNDDAPLKAERLMGPFQGLLHGLQAD